MKLSLSFLLLFVLLIAMNSMAASTNKKVQKGRLRLASMTALLNSSNPSLLPAGKNPIESLDRYVSRNLLPKTPKGLTLNNHFGARPNQSPYGPQPELVKKVFSRTKADGKTEEKTEVKIIHLRSRDNDIKQCEIEQKLYYPLCFALNDCDLCAASPYCGWCGATQRCLPGGVKEAECPNACFHEWIFDFQHCRRRMTYGNFTNIAADATKLISPEIADPKVDVETVVTHPAVVKTPVLLGNVIESSEYQTINKTSGKIIGKSTVNLKKPILGEIHRVMTVDTIQEQYVDLKSGRRLDNVKDVKNHGIEE